MRIGRCGVFTTPNGTLGVASVVALIDSNRLVGKEANSGQLIEFKRGEFHTFDSCNMNPNAAEVVREKAGVQAGGREYVAESISGAVPLAQVELGAGAVSITDEAVAQAVKQIRNKKRVTSIPTALANFIRPFVSGKGKANRAVLKTSVSRTKNRTAKAKA